MWLLDTLTLKLKEFTDPLPYAILSHTWGSEEVSLQDIEKPASKALRGYQKIEQACALARSQRIGAIWIDTCCIDKTSSAELSEAINSMYAWYRHASICYVYLNDFSFLIEEYGPSGRQDSRFLRKIRKSRWFTRGWTLQEFLAPYNVEFYDRHWHYIGDKIDLAHQLSSITGIDQQHITERDSVSRASVAARMSWASGRSTTRPEDEAYCLMGLFKVNMPLIYGEGKKAFLRLQHEIVRSSDDESLFAWHAGNSTARAGGIFAESPTSFAYSRNIAPYPFYDTYRPPYTITNKGLLINASVFHFHSNMKFRFHSNMHKELISPSAKPRGSEFGLLRLGCATANIPEQPFMIILKKVSYKTYVRFLPPMAIYENLITEEIYERYLEHAGDSDWESHPEIYIRESISGWDSVNPEASRGDRSACIYPDQTNGKHYALQEWYVSHLGTVKPSFYGWKVRLFDPPGSVILKFKHVEGESFTIILNFDVGAVNDSIRGALDVPTAGATFAEVVDSHKADLSQPHSIQDNSKQSVRTSDGSLVDLVRDLRSPDVDGFWLRITRA